MGLWVLLGGRGGRQLRYSRGMGVTLCCFQCCDPLAKAVRNLTTPSGLFEYSIEKVSGLIMSLAFKGELERELFSTTLVAKTVSLPLLPASGQSCFTVGESDARLLEGFCGSAKVILEFLNIRMSCGLSHLEFAQCVPLEDMAQSRCCQLRVFSSRLSRPRGMLTGR
jgi:hypothetical protein